MLTPPIGHHQRAPSPPKSRRDHAIANHGYATPLTCLAPHALTENGFVRTKCDGSAPPPGWLDLMLLTARLVVWL